MFLTERMLHGTTSAYAENTLKMMWIIISVRNYLRVRGEYIVLSSGMDLILELPPRTRRIHPRTVGVQKLRGTTSAYAENTINSTLDADQ